MPVVRTTFERKKPRIAVLKEGLWLPAPGARVAGVMVVLLLIGSEYQARRKHGVCSNTRSLRPATL
jgi:hypothetical protein